MLIYSIFLYSSFFHKKTLYNSLHLWFIAYSNFAITFVFCSHYVVTFVFFTSLKYVSGLKVPQRQPQNVLTDQKHVKTKGKYASNMQAKPAVSAVLHKSLLMALSKLGNAVSVQKNKVLVWHNWKKIEIYQYRIVSTLMEKCLVRQNKSWFCSCRQCTVRVPYHIGYPH